MNALNALKPGDKRRLFEQKRRALQDELKQQDWEGPVDHQEPYADYQEEEEEANYQATGYQTNASPDETMSYQRYQETDQEAAPTDNLQRRQPFAPPRDSHGDTTSRGRSILPTSTRTDEDVGDMRRSLEELITRTLVAEGAPYTNREALLNENDPYALIHWGKALSQHAKEMRRLFLRQRKVEDHKGTKEPLGEGENQLVIVYINFHASAIDKFLLASLHDPSKSFREVQPAALASPRGSSSNGQAPFPSMMLASEWGLASLRYGNALERQVRTSLGEYGPVLTAMWIRTTVEALILSSVTRLSFGRASFKRIVVENGQEW